MNFNKETVKAAILKKGYKWYDQEPMLVGIRSKLNVPNVFNDILCLFMPDGTEHFWNITTDPGTTYLVKPINPKGCAVLKEGQYLNVWYLGYHQGKADHRALRQCGTFTVFRDNDKDLLAEPVGTEDTGTNFGINCHGAAKNADTTKIGPWSAGCQVHQRWSNKERMIDVLCDYERKNWIVWKKTTKWVFGSSGIKYHYTLLNETDL
jgi:hypothetical protein